jgi:uncharacterized repeat protein (TIGR01451 family)
LNFTQGRHDANFSNISWNGSGPIGVLSFDLSSSISLGANLSTSLPVNYSNYKFQSALVDGNPVTPQVQMVNGAPYVFIQSAPGTHTISVNYQKILFTAAVNLNITASQDPVIAGQSIPLKYTVKINNAGPDSATNSHLQYQLPAGLNFIAAVPSQGTCAYTTVLDCTLGTIPYGVQAQVDISLSVSPDIRGSISSLISIIEDPSPGGQNATIRTAVNTSGDVSVRTTDSISPNPYAPGKPLNYVLTLNNAGPSSVLNPLVTDTLPAGVVLNAITAVDWSCSINLQTVTCLRGKLDVNLPSTISINTTVNPDATGYLANSAQISSSDPDPDLKNNQSFIFSPANWKNLLPVISSGK